MAIAMFSELPKLIEIEPTLTCNLRCKMCHVSYEATESRSTFPAELTEKLAGLGGVDILLGSNYEPTMNRGFPEIVRSLTRHGLRIELITNGTLLEGEALEALAEANIRLLVVSFDGARKETYERIRRRANYEKTLNRILAAKERIASETLFALNSTIMRSNLEEIGDSVALWDRVGFDQIRFIAMVVRHPDMEPESSFSVRDRFHTNLDAAGEELIASRRRISMASSYFNTSPLRHKFPANVHGPIVSSGHPAMRPIPELRAEHQLGPGPGMTWPCRSPWTFARILPTGDVELCFKYIVGNLRRHSFKDIWFGSRAIAVRRRVAEDAGICPVCEHYLPQGRDCRYDPGEFVHVRAFDPLRAYRKIQRGFMAKALFCTASRPGVWVGNNQPHVLARRDSGSNPRICARDSKKPAGGASVAPGRRHRNRCRCRRTPAKKRMGSQAPSAVIDRIRSLR